MSVGIRPLGARVLIKKIEVEETTDAGFILTNANKKAPQQASHSMAETTSSTMVKSIH